VCLHSSYVSAPAHGQLICTFARADDALASRWLMLAYFAVGTQLHGRTCRTGPPVNSCSFGWISAHGPTLSLWTRDVDDGRIAEKVLIVTVLLVQRECGGYWVLAAIVTMVDRPNSRPIKDERVENI
jgi:hypothetical protein